MDFTRSELDIIATALNDAAALYAAYINEYGSGTEEAEEYQRHINRLLDLEYRIKTYLKLESMLDDYE
jgi:hypothetical protein